MEMEYIYLTALSVYIPIYLFIYLKSSLRLRREMLFMSIINAIVSPLSSYLWWNKDWWLPPSVFGGQSYVFAPEDVLLGFIFGGLVSIIYEFSFGKHLLNTEHPHKKSFHLLVLFSVIICAASFSVLNLNSFYSIVVAMLFVTISIWFVRKDLIKSSIYTGILSLVLCLPGKEKYRHNYPKQHYRNRYYDS